MPWLVALVAVASGLGIHGWSAVAKAHALRLPPRLETLAWALAFIGMVALIWAMIRGTRRLLAARGAAWAGWKIAGLVVSHLALVLATPAAMLVSDPWFLGRRHVESMPHPHGGRYHLYAGGLSCSYEIFVRDPGSLYLRRVDLVMPNTCVGDPHLVWDAEDDRPVVVGADGVRLTSGTWKGLHWGPH